MNLIDFHVTEIISETTGKVYELFGMSKEEVDSEPNQPWREYLLSDGMKQKYRYWDDGGNNEGERVFSLLSQKPYFVGYVGQH